MCFFIYSSDSHSNEIRYLFGLPPRPPTPEPEPEPEPEFMSKREKKILGSVVSFVVTVGIILGIKFGIF